MSTTDIEQTGWLKRTRSERVAEAQRLAVGGLYQRQIAERMGLSLPCVSQLIRFPDHHPHSPQFVPEERACEWCGETFRSRKSTQRFCSKSHREKAMFRRKMVDEGRVCSICGGSLVGDSRGTGFCLEHRLEHRWPLHKRIERLWAEGCSEPEIAATLELPYTTLLGIIAQARDNGFNLPLRRADVPFDREQPKALAKAYRRHSGNADESLTDKQKCVLRVLHASPEPLGTTQLCRVLERVGGQSPWPEHTHMCLKGLKRRGLVHNVKAEVVRWRQPKSFWFVPALPNRQVLTLDDARAERELATLIAEQTRDESRGYYAEVDYKTVSLDAPMSDGSSWHEYHEDVA